MYKIGLFPGDGIGYEVMAEMQRVLAWFRSQGILACEIEEGRVGGSAYDADGVPLSAAHRDLALACDVVFLGAVGGPKWADVPYDVRPEAGLLQLRKDLDLFANLRPAICYPSLCGASSLKPELVSGLDLLFVRELTGGVYFGSPKELIDFGGGKKKAVDTQVYETFEIERVACIAFELAKARRGLVHSAEKRNVMKTGVLWHEVVSHVHKTRYPEVRLEHILADNCGMQLVRAPLQFDVILTDNLFGDLLSDVAAMLTGSLGMLPSASLGAVNPQTTRRRALYEPVHGSAPDIAGKGLANPLAMISSFAMALHYSFGLGDWAKRLDHAISEVLEQGIRTEDIWEPGCRKVGTSEMTRAVLEALERAHDH